MRRYAVYEYSESLTLPSFFYQTSRTSVLFLVFFAYVFDLPIFKRILSVGCNPAETVRPFASSGEKLIRAFLQIASVAEFSS